MPRIQINRIENTELNTYGRGLYPGEFMIVRGEDRSKDLVLLGVNDFDPICTKPTENAAKFIVTGTTVVNSDTGGYSYSIDNVLRIGNANTGSDGLKFSKLSDNTDAVLIPNANTLACSKRPIIAGLTPDFMSYQKKDEVALVSELDGAWVSSSQTLSSFTAVDTVEVDLSDYLPNDNKSYLVWLTISQYSSASTPSALAVSSSLYNLDKIIGIMTRDTVPWVGIPFVIPIGSDRKLTLSRTQGACGAFNCSSMGYRKIGEI